MQKVGIRNTYDKQIFPKFHSQDKIAVISLIFFVSSKIFLELGSQDLQLYPRLVYCMPQGKEYTQGF